MADEKQPVEKAIELFVYAPVGVALYVRDMLPSMMGVFVSRGKREVQSHIPGRAPAPPTPPPMPPEVKRRIDESVGVAKYMAEGGLGVAREFAGSGLGVAREVAGSAVAECVALRACGRRIGRVSDGIEGKDRAAEPPIGQCMKIAGAGSGGSHGVTGGSNTIIGPAVRDGCFYADD